MTTDMISGGSTAAPQTTTGPTLYRSRGALGAVVGVVLLLGVVVGTVWAAMTPTLTAEVVSPTTARIVGGDDSAEFGAVAVFALLMVAYGMIAAGLLWAAARRWRGPLSVGALLASTVVGTGLAALVGELVVAWRFDDPADLPVGSLYTLVGALIDGPLWQLDIQPWILLCCAPFGAMLVYLILSLLSLEGDLGVGDGPDETD